ncbi:DUF6049 family protein [Streptomyces sp. NPDC060194]|uniref:DUF6049 family protein n=1 Tax=Streptomyces sp. NPDC060194 TaxID=3347069 RepID=UPI0036482BC3
MTTRTGERVAEAADTQGPPPPPARRGWRRTTLTVLTGLPLLAGLLQVTAASPAAAAPDVTGPRTVDVSLDALSPAAPREGDRITVSGTVTNKGERPVTDAHVGIRVGAELDSRSAIEDATKQEKEFAPWTDGEEVADGKYRKSFARLAPGVPHGFSITLPADALDLGGDGIYQLGVSLSGETGGNGEEVLGIQRTFLPWQPEDTERRTRMTYLWPLISSAHLTAETASDEAQTPTFEDDELAEEIAPGGRLQQMVSLGADLPVTWVLDPDLLASVEAMRKPYLVKDDDSPRSDRNKKLADQWLADLEKAVAGKKIVALPFGDTDVASLAHHGTPVVGSLNHLKTATERAETTVESILLDEEVSTDYAWPAEGAVDPAIVQTATSAGADTVLARSDSLKDSLTYTPTAVRAVGGGTKAVVADAGLSTAFEGDLTSAESSTRAVQEFLAQSLAITLQEPGKQRSIVVAPQRMPSVSQAQSMARAIDALSDQRWSSPADLDEAADATPDPRATTRIPGAGAYPKRLSKQELPVSAFRDLGTTQGMLDRFQVILSEPDRVTTPFGSAINRSLSNSWRGDASGASGYRAAVESYLQGLTDKVHLIPKSDATLSGRSATIPVTVQNNLVQGVENLTLKLVSDRDTRLDVGDPQRIEVSGGHSQSVKFATTVKANGPAKVTAQLFTADGTPYGEPITFGVDVTEVTPTVMLVIAGGLLLLVLAGIRMYGKRKRAAREAPAEEDPEGPTGPAAEGDDGPGQPSDPRPDTAPESTEPSGTGEKVDR